VASWDCYDGSLGISVGRVVLHGSANGRGMLRVPTMDKAQDTNSGRAWCSWRSNWGRRWWCSRSSIDSTEGEGLGGVYCRRGETEGLLGRGKCDVVGLA
jgi:hypothetical protein